MHKPFFKTYGVDLLNKGYLITPVPVESKKPLLLGWASKVLELKDVDAYTNHGVGILCGKGDFPIVAVDIDSTDESLVSHLSEWCRANIGDTCERVGRAPKKLLVYRVETTPWPKTASPFWKDEKGALHRLELLGTGQQFVAYNVHPQTKGLYTWTDSFGGIAARPAANIPVLSKDKALELLALFQELVAKRGMVTTTRVWGQKKEQGQKDNESNFFARTNREAMRQLSSWVPKIFPESREYNGGFRITSKSLNRNLQEDLSISPQGIVDFGVSDKPNTREGKRTPIDVVLEWLPYFSKSPLEQPSNALEAAVWLCDCIGVPKEQLGYEEPAGLAAYPATEKGNAQRMLKHYGKDLLYVSAAGAWLRWTGLHWEKSYSADVEAYALDTITALPDELDRIENPEAKAKFYAFCMRSQTASMVKSMVSLVRATRRISGRLEDFDQNPNLLGVGNGVVDLNSGVLLPAKREHRITLTTPVHYDPAASCPLFCKTVSDVFYGEPETISFFQRLIGYSLTGNPIENLVVFPFGHGCNGKSTVLNAIYKVLGDHAKTASSEAFVSSHRDDSAPKENLLKLKGSRFVCVNEMAENRCLREDLVKALSGGDTISARGVYAKGSVEFKPSWVIFMPTNHLPIVKGIDNGIWRRLLPIPFKRNFDNDPTLKKDVSLPERLLKEAEGILAWCVEGALKYKAEGLQIPKAVLAEKAAYKSDMDVLAEWLEECCAVDPTLTDTSENLWLSWSYFAGSRGETYFIPSARSLGRRLSIKGFTPIRNARNQKGSVSRGFKGLKVKSNAL